MHPTLFTRSSHNSVKNNTFRFYWIFWCLLSFRYFSMSSFKNLFCARFGIFRGLVWQFSLLRPLKGTNGRQKTYEIFHVYCIFYSGFMCQITVIFGVTKDGSLLLNTLASWNCFTCRNFFQNGANDMSECLTCEMAFCKKSSKFCIVLIIRF